MRFKPKKTDNYGFTLLEVLLAMLIFATVMTALYWTFRTGILAWHKGENSMELYQNARISMDRINQYLRRAVSPNFRWNILDQESEQELDAILEENPEININPPEENIVFKGSTNEVRLVVDEITPGAKIAYDLVEIKFSLNSEKNFIEKTVTKSVIQNKLEYWRKKWAEKTQKELDDSYEEAPRFAVEYVGETAYIVDAWNIRAPDWEEKKVVFARNIEAMSFLYYNGKKWLETWDSQAEVLPDEEEETSGEDEEAASTTEEEPPKMGLPQAVQVSFTLTNGDRITTITEVPGSDFNEIKIKKSTKASKKRPPL